MKTTFMVTGIMRSGTSMMMRAIYEGMGQKVPMLISDERERMLNTGEDHPNHEYLEPPMSSVISPFFPRPYAGHLIKILNAGTYPLWPLSGGMHTLQMWRDPDAIKESWDRHADVLGEPPGWIPDGYGMRMRLNTSLLLNRKDVISHTDMWYEHALEDPMGAMQFLESRGWPIVDHDAGAAVIDAGRRKYPGGMLEIPDDFAAKVSALAHAS